MGSYGEKAMGVPNKRLEPIFHNYLNLKGIGKGAGRPERDSEIALCQYSLQIVKVLDERGRGGKKSGFSEALGSLGGVGFG